MPYKDKKKKNEYQNEWMKKRRDEYLKDKKCIECESTKNLEIHHRDPKIKEDHRIWSWSEERRNKELKKCDILCEDCHINLHAKEKRIGLIHGTITGYKRYNCRCKECKKANALVMKRWRLKNKGL